MSELRVDDVAAAGQVWRGPLFELGPDQQRQGPIAGSEATVRRADDAVDFELRTSGLTPGHGYTVWLMAFNDPDACTGDDAPDGFRCGPADMGNPDAAFGLMFSGAGTFAESDRIEFRGRRVAGDPSGVELDTAGLVDARKAEIHLRVRDHGPVQAALEADQIGTIMGGCTDDSPPGGTGRRGTYNCRDVQATGM